MPLLDSAKSPVGHAITEGFTLGSGGSAKKLILIFMSQPYGAPNLGASRREKSRHDRGPAHRSQLAKLPASSCCRPESAFSRVRQPKAVIKRPIQHRAGLLLDTLTSLLHFTTVSEWWTRIKLILRTNRPADGCAEGVFREHQDRSPPAAELRCTPLLRGPDR